jgi:hypothetical protein
VAQKKQNVTPMAFSRRPPPRACAAGGVGGGTGHENRRGGPYILAPGQQVLVAAMAMARTHALPGINVNVAGHEIQVGGALHFRLYLQ